MSMFPVFEGKSVVVTGASRGIGLGVARAFASAGANLTLVADDLEILEVAAGLGARGYVADITDVPAVAEVFGSLDRVDVLINNAGVERMTPLQEWSGSVEADFRRVIEVNVVGTTLVTVQALPLLDTGSAIVNTASTWGRVAEPLFGAYVASKHAIIGLTKTWAKELGGRGIRVNAVCPGWVRTDAAMASLGRMSSRMGIPEQTLLDRIVASQALPGLMQPDDIAGPYLYLASSLAANVTGQTLGVDRGEVPW